MTTHPKVRSRGDSAINSGNVSRRQPNNSFKVINLPLGVYITQTQLQTPLRAWPLWTRNAFVVACIAALISSLYWARARQSLQELQENSPPFIVQDLPGKGKGMIALRDIMVGTVNA